MSKKSKRLRLDFNFMAKIYYARLPEDWRKEQKYKFLEEKQHIYNIEWQEITPDAKHNWLTEGMRDEFETFIPLGTKEAKAAKGAEVETIFKTYSNGYILRLIGQIVTVSLETVRTVKELEKLKLSD